MQSERNLLDHFRISGITETDILTYFRQGDSHAKNGIYYFLPDQVKVEFNKHGRIKSIVGSPDSIFIKRAIQELNAISQEQELKQGRIVVEGISPLYGFYRYKEIFQISPLKSLPNHIANGRSKFPFPFLIEYKFRTSKNNGIKINRMNKRREEILLILNLLIYGGVSDVNNSSNREVWVAVPTGWRDPTQEEIEMSCEYKHPLTMERVNMLLGSGFGLDEIDVNDGEFADTSTFEPIKLVEYNTYYQKVGVGIDDEISLPSRVNQYLDKYFEMEDRSKINRSLYWLLKHRESWELSKSISFNCLIQAIEVLMENQKNTEQCRQDGCTNTKIISNTCEKCSLPITGVGPTQAFRDFVETYAGNIPKKLKDELYGLRSSISHGSLILEMDSSNYEGFNFKSHNQRDLMDIGRKIVVVCLLNWMMNQ